LGLFAQIVQKQNCLFDYGEYCGLEWMYVGFFRVLINLLILIPGRNVGKINEIIGYIGDIKLILEFFKNLVCAWFLGLPFAVS